MKQLQFALAILLACVTWLSYADEYEKGVKAHDAGDFKTAVNIWRPLADQGNAPAQHLLGWAYDQGEGVPRNYQEAIKWWRKAAEQGYADAQSRLALSYATGSGIPQNMQEAMK